MIGTILGILGVVITLGFGGYSIWVYKKSKKNVSLEFRNKECYSLFSEDVNRLNIELIYNKTTLNNTLILLKAKLINNGHVDIDKNRIYTPLKIKSSDVYNWLEATVTSAPRGAKTNIELLSGQEVELNWDLLKQNEYIEIEALVEIVGKLEKDEEKGTDFYNNLSFDYRITDLNSIQKEKQISNSKRSRSIYNKVTQIMAIITVIIGVVFLSFEFFPQLNFMEKQVVSYAINKDNNELVTLIASENPNEITLTIEGNTEKQKITVKEFNKSYQLKGIKRTSIDPKGSTLNRVIGIIYIIMGGFLFYIKRKKKKVANN